MKSQSFLIFILLIWSACVPPPIEEELTKIDLNWKAQDLRNIHDFKDQHQLDSLFQFFSDKDPSIRISVAQAFSTYKSESTLDSLYKLLNDNVPEVREMAAFSIGQIGSANAESILLDAISRDTSNRKLNAYIFEAIGKLGSEKSLAAMANAPDYKYSEDIETLGLIRGMYQYALRGIVFEKATDKIIRILADKLYALPARIMAANYLSRAKEIDLSKHVGTISQVFSKSTSPYIKMALALALGKTKSPEAATFLMNSFEVEKDYRVKLNILRGLGNYPVARVNETMLEALKDENIHIANTAADYFIINGRSTNANAYRNIAREEKRWPLKAKMYQAANTHLTSAYTIAKRNSNKEIVELFEKAKTNFEKAAYLKALGPELSNTDFIINKGLKNDNRLVQITAANIFINLLVDKKVSPRTRKGKSMVAALKEAMNSNSAALISVISPIFSDKDLRLGNEENIAFLEEKLKSLKLPKNLEAVNTVRKVISDIKGEEFEALTPEFNHPINWSVVTAVSDSTTADILTNKGVIMVRFFPFEAPGAVANFVDLSMHGFYDQKIIHRVVPNFVIQGGGADGDGYGNLDYTIRTELANRYYDDEGYLGMARSGFDTEDTQWFITHSPTPHLDGKYTIFGKVIKGMETVHAIEEGDEIRKINIVNY